MKILKVILIILLGMLILWIGLWLVGLLSSLVYIAFILFILYVIGMVVWKLFLSGTPEKPDLNNQLNRELKTNEEKLSGAVQQLEQIKKQLKEKQ